MFGVVYVFVCVCVCGCVFVIVRVCVCARHTPFPGVSHPCSRGWQKERESATNEDTLAFLLILGLIIPAYLQ